MRDSMKWGLAAILVLGASTSAQADVVVTPDGRYQTVRTHRAMIAHQGQSEVLIEELHLQSEDRRALWIKPFPAAPSFEEAPSAPFATLDSGTTIEPPLNKSVRARVFGPSIVTLLSQRLFPDPKEDAQPPGPQAPSRDLQLLDRQIFSGTVYTSTITRQHVLPKPMQDWLHRNGFSLTQHLMGDLSAHLNRGASVCMTLLSDSAPGSPGLARIGPVRQTVPTNDPVFPTLRRTDSGNGQTLFELYMIGTGPLVPSAYATLWDEEPWLQEDVQRGRFRTVYAEKLEETGTVLLDLEQRLGVNAMPNPFLVRSRFRQGSEALGEIVFEPTTNFVRIPSGTERGSGMDLFLCMLLGLTPLIYTPESWFLLWWGARARANRTSDRQPLAARLWPLFVIVVAIYWAVTLPGAARLAATIPLLIGLTLLIMPRTDHEARRVRVNFSKKKKDK